MKFGQFTEYNLKNILPEKSYAKYGEAWHAEFLVKSQQAMGGETIPKPFSKTKKTTCRPLAFTSYKAFLKKNKMRFETSLPVSVSA